MRLVVLRGKRVINRTQARPFVWHWVRLCDAGYLLGQGDGEASLEVEVDVAVEEPGARVVRLHARGPPSMSNHWLEHEKETYPEPDGDVISSSTSVDDVAAGRVVVVVRVTARAPNDRERMLELRVTLAYAWMVPSDIPEHDVPRASGMDEARQERSSR